jgi:hypothetical protein
MVCVCVCMCAPTFKFATELAQTKETTENNEAITWLTPINSFSSRVRVNTTLHRLNKVTVRTLSLAMVLLGMVPLNQGTGPLNQGTEHLNQVMGRPNRAMAPPNQGTVPLPQRVTRHRRPYSSGSKQWTKTEVEKLA